MISYLPLQSPIFPFFLFPRGWKKKTENNFVLQQFSVTNFTDNKSQFNAALDLILFGWYRTNVWDLHDFFVIYRSVWTLTALSLPQRPKGRGITGGESNCCWYIKSTLSRKNTYPNVFRFFPTFSCFFFTPSEKKNGKNLSYLPIFVGDRHKYMLLQKKEKTIPLCVDD